MLIPYIIFGVLFLAGLSLCIYFLSARTVNLYCYLGASFTIFATWGALIFYSARTRAVQNVPIFSLVKDPVFISLASFTFLVTVLIILLLTFYAHFCPSNQRYDRGSGVCTNVRCKTNQVFNPELQQCEPDCPKGSVLDPDRSICIERCDHSNDCPTNQQCVNHQCCDMTTHEITDQGLFCCPKESVFCLSNITPCPEKDKICCAGKKVCQGIDGKPICCLESGATCLPDPEGGQFCSIPCGASQCQKGETCLAYKDLFGPDPSKTVQSCEGLQSSPQCTLDDEILSHPAGISNFFPAYANTLDETTMNNVLNCDYFSKATKDKCEKDLQDYVSKDKNNKDGYICGIPDKNSVRFRSLRFKNNTPSSPCPKQDFLANILPEITDRAVIVRDAQDPSHYTLNTRISDQRKTLPENYTSTIHELKGNVVKNKVENLEYGQVFKSIQNLCTPFATCISKKECPFGNPNYQCFYSDNDPSKATGIIQRFVETVYTIDVSNYDPRVASSWKFTPVSKDQCTGDKGPCFSTEKKNDVVKSLNVMANQPFLTNHSSKKVSITKSGNTFAFNAFGNTLIQCNQSMAPTREFYMRSLENENARTFTTNDNVIDTNDIILLFSDDGNNHPNSVLSGVVQPSGNLILDSNQGTCGDPDCSNGTINNVSDEAYWKLDIEPSNVPEINSIESILGKKFLIEGRRVILQKYKGGNDNKEASTYFSKLQDYNCEYLTLNDHPKGEYFFFTVL